MKYFLQILFTVLLFSSIAIKVNAQSNKYPVAPEVWSTPKEVAVINKVVGRAQSPSISFDGKKLYFNWIGYTEKTDTGWSIPIRLNNNINQHLADWPCISPNGKRLYFSWFVNNGWDLYYSDCDSLTNDWGIAKRCDIVIKEPDYLWEKSGCTLPDDTTIIFMSSNSAFISHFNTQTQAWDSATGFPTPTLQHGSDFGIYVSPGKSKIYSVGFRPDTTKDGQYYGNYDIIVSYKDTLSPRGYTPPYILNFSLQADTLYFAGKYSSRFEGYPTLTPDGKTMYFTADYHDTITIYETKLLIDENGDTITSAKDESHVIIPDKIKLYPVYPNPFNPELNIRYSLKEEAEISLAIYDILGREVKNLYEGRKQAGEYNAIFSSENISSGIYLIKLATKKSMHVQKAAFIK